MSGKGIGDSRRFPIPPDLDSSESIPRALVDDVAGR